MVTVEEVMRILREGFHAWDPRAQEAVQRFGLELLIRQDAHRIVETVAWLNGTAASGRLLEIGTGYLGLAMTIRRLFPSAEIVGVEYPGRRYVWSPAYQHRLRQDRIRLVGCDISASAFPFREASFDAVTLAEVVEHLPPNVLPRFLKDVARIVRPGGSLLVTTPNLAAWVNRELLLRGDSPGQQSPLLDIDGAFGHLRLYTMQELVELLEAAGWRVSRTRYIDQVQLGISLIRSVIRTFLRVVKSVVPALRDTCVIHAVRVGPEQHPGGGRA